VSGEVQMQFSIVDSANPAASPEEIQKKFRSVIQADLDDDDALSRVSTANTNKRPDDDLKNDIDQDDEDVPDTSDETDSTSKSGILDKQAKKKRLARLRRRSIAVRTYEFVGKDSDVSGLILVEILKITDLPPERNSESWLKGSSRR
jgi:phosphatidylserine decarboxylase